VEGEAPPEIPPAIERYESFNYNECLYFAAELYFMENDWSRIDAAYEDPPFTTEQVLHPEKYLRREPPTSTESVDLTKRLGDGWELWTSGMFGEFDIYNYLLTILQSEEFARTAAEGWGVGWIGVYADEPADDASGTSDRAILVHLALEFDTQGDAEEFGAIFPEIFYHTDPEVITHTDDLGRICWQGPSEYGYYITGEDNKRFDIVIGSTENARGRAISDDLFSGPAATCPASSPSAPQ
jgi:hypothetical protein